MVLASTLCVTDACGQQASAQVGEVETQRITRSTASSSNPFSSLVDPDPYYVNLSTAYTHTTNAFSDFREQKDWLLDTNLSAGWRTTLGSSLYLDWAFVANRSDYANQDTLSRNMLGTRVMLAGLAFGKVPYYLSYSGNWFYDSSYDSSGLNFHTLSAVVPFWRKNVGKGNLTVSATLNWIKAQPSDFDQITPGLSVRYSVPVTGKDRIDLSVMQSYASFQHFAPGQFPQDRQDWRTTASLQLVHTFTKQLQLTLGVTYMRNDSNLAGFETTTGRFGGIYDYKTWNFTPTLGLNYNF
ncbi:MAG: hypothetical protein IPK32_02190 [Verrucomicrobiaceae bacterium]|nr:hypothetical protein [Verrucomicrobiaceae bacterium]